MKVAIFTILLVVLTGLSAAGQYSTVYIQERGMKIYPRYSAYLKIIEQYNQTKDVSSTVKALDSLSQIALKQKGYTEYLCYKNEKSQVYKFNNMSDKAYNDLKTAMKTYKNQADTVHIEYAVALRFLRSLKTTFEKERDKGELLETQLQIIKKLGIKGEPLTNNLVDLGLYLVYSDKDKALDILYKARKSAINNNDYASMAVADYTIISNGDVYDLAETIIDVLKNDLYLLESIENPPLNYQVYIAFFNYLIGNNYYSELNDTAKASYYSKKALQCMDTLTYPLSNLKASSHANLTIIYSEQKKVEPFWNHFKRAKQIALTQPMNDYNKCLALSEIANASVKINPDTALSLIKKIKLEKGYNFFENFILAAEARAYYEKREYNKSNELILSFLPSKESKNGLPIPELIDSVDISIQKFLLQVMQENYRALYEQTNSSKYFVASTAVINRQNQLLNQQFSSKVFSNQLSAINSDLEQFYDQGLTFLMNHYQQVNKDVFFEVLFSSKALQLNSNLMKNRYQASLEKKDTAFEIIKKQVNHIQRINTLLNQENLPIAEVRRLKGELNNHYIQHILQRIAFDKQITIDQEVEAIPSLSDVQAALNKNEALIEYYYNDTCLMVSMIMADTVLLKNTQQDNFERLLSKQLYKIKTGSDVTDLFPVLFPGFENELNKLSRLIIIPYKKMSTLPFESIRFPKTNEPLISKLSISYNYSTPIWYANRTLKKENVDLKILSIAPVFNQKKQDDNDLLVSAYRGGFNLTPLTYSLEELSGIKKLSIKNKIDYFQLTNKESSEKNLKANINNYNILHFATHGLTNKENYERSGIFLYPEKNDCDSCLHEDNFLSLGEIYNLDLNAELAVLSACNSGSGKIAEGEGIMALPKGFIYAGVPNVIASLWKVHDENTKELMVAFYKHLIEDKVSYAEALRRAKLDCIEKGFLPVDWAGFVLIGN